MKKSLLILGATALMAGMTPAFAEPEEGSPAIADETTEIIDLVVPEIAFGGGGVPVCEELNLTDDQLEKIHAIKLRRADEVGTKKVELMAQMRKLKDLLSQPTLDRQAVQQTQDKISGLKADIANQMINGLMDAHDVMSMDQRKQLRHKFLVGGFGPHFHHHGLDQHWGHHAGGPNEPAWSSSKIDTALAN